MITRKLHASKSFGKTYSADCKIVKLPGLHAVTRKLYKNPVTEAWKSSFAKQASDKYRMKLSTDEESMK